MPDSNRPPTDYKSVALPDELKGLMVRMEGLEPPRLAAPVPKTGVSTISPHPHMVLQPRIELRIYPYHGYVIPFNYRSRYNTIIN